LDIPWFPIGSRSSMRGSRFLLHYRSSGKNFAISDLIDGH
jgi:hypothetical protein